MSEALLALIIILQLLDAWTTFRVLEQGGREKNPILAWAMSGIGVTLVLIASKAITIAIVTVSYLFLPAWLFLLIFTGFAVFMGWIVENNWRNMR